MPCLNLKPPIPPLPDLGGLSFDIPLPAIPELPPLLCCKPPALPDFLPPFPVIPPLALPAVQAALRTAQATIQKYLDIALVYNMKCPRI